MTLTILTIHSFPHQSQTPIPCQFQVRKSIFIQSNPSTDQSQPKDYEPVPDFWAKFGDIFLVGEEKQETEDYDPWTQMSAPLPQQLEAHMSLALDISKKEICFGFTHFENRFRLFLMGSDLFEEIKLDKSVVPLAAIFFIVRLMRSLVNHISLSFSQSPISFRIACLGFRKMLQS